MGYWKSNGIHLDQAEARMLISSSTRIQELQVYDYNIRSSLIYMQPIVVKSSSSCLVELCNKFSLFIYRLLDRVQGIDNKDHNEIILLGIGFIHTVLVLGIGCIHFVFIRIQSCRWLWFGDRVGIAKKRLSESPFFYPLVHCAEVFNHVISGRKRSF